MDSAIWLIRRRNYVQCHLIDNKECHLVDNKDNIIWLITKTMSSG